MTSAIHRKVFVQLKDGTLHQLTTIKSEDWGALDATKKGVPVYINENGTAVWPEPDVRYDLFEIGYRGTVGP